MNSLYSIKKACLIILIFLQFGCLDTSLKKEELGLSENLEKINLPPESSKIQSGNIINLGTNTIIRESDLETGFEQLIDTKNTSLLSLISSDKKLSLRVAFGSDNKYHAVNAFFTGFNPFYVDSPLKAWKLLSKRIQYKKDNESTDSRDIWFNSAETFNRRTGDCEDSSILLADWLISLGYDARVAVGSIKGAGHAWVIIQDNQTKNWFLLESTHYPVYNTLPLAAQQADYKPKIMFNKEYVWENMDEKNNNYYDDQKAWRKILQFKPDNINLKDFSDNYQQKLLSTKRNNFYQELIAKNVIYKWNKPNLNYCFDDKTQTKTELKKRFKRAFDLWQRKSQIFTFREVFNEKEADILIITSDQETIATVKHDLTIPGGNINGIKKENIYHAKMIFPQKYFAFNFNKDFREYKILQNLIVYSIGMTLGLNPVKSDTKYCLSDWDLGNQAARDCESLTPEINTLNMIYK